MTDNLSEVSRRARLWKHLRRNIVAYLALVIAVSMTPLPSYAHGLIGTAQIKNGAVTTKKLAKNAVKTKKINAAAVTKAKLAPDARGLSTVVVRVETAPVATDATGAITADCLEGEVATGGGGLLLNAFTTPVYIRSYPSFHNSEGSADTGDTPVAWTTRIFNNTGSDTTIEGYVICASK